MGFSESCDGMVPWTAGLTGEPEPKLQLSNSSQTSTNNTELETQVASTRKHHATLQIVN